MSGNFKDFPEKSWKMGKVRKLSRENGVKETIVAIQEFQCICRVVTLKFF